MDKQKQDIHDHAHYTKSRFQTWQVSDILKEQNLWYAWNVYMSEAAFFCFLHNFELICQLLSLQSETPIITQLYISLL